MYAGKRPSDRSSDAFLIQPRGAALLDRLLPYLPDTTLAPALHPPKRHHPNPEADDQTAKDHQKNDRKHLLSLFHTRHDRRPP